MPDRSPLGQLVTVGEQCPHVVRIEVLFVRKGKVGTDIGKVVINAITLSGKVDADNIIVAVSSC